VLGFQASRASLLSSLADWGSKRRFVATIMEWAVPPSSAHAPVAVTLRGHLAAGVAVRARGGGKQLRVVVGEPKPLADEHSNLSEMRVTVHLDGLTRGLFYLEVEAPAAAAAGASQQGAKKRTLKTVVPVLVSSDSAVRREVSPAPRQSVMDVSHSRCRVRYEGRRRRAEERQVNWCG